MFSNACRLARRFTRPVVIARRYYDGTVECGIGAFIVVNADGWAVTAAHLWRASEAARLHASEIADHYRRIAEILKDCALSPAEKQARVFQLKPNPRWITGVTFWWGRDGVELRDISVLAEGDLVLGRLDPYVPEPPATYPILKNPFRLDVGTSLCKFGYPFQKIDAGFDEARQRFDLPAGVRSIDPFPMEGMYTRTLDAGKSGDGRYDVKYLETSSPGLVGQSGGPIFDARGTVWAVQSRTDALPYGCCAGPGKKGGKTVERHYLNVGVGVHPAVVVPFLKDRRVRFSLSEY